MKPCDVCHELGDLDFLGRCEKCFRAYLDNLPTDSMYSTTKRLYHTDGIKGGISPAHADDIKRRVVGPDGSVFRDRGRFSIVVK